MIVHRLALSDGALSTPEASCDLVVCDFVVLARRHSACHCTSYNSSPVLLIREPTGCLRNDLGTCGWPLRLRQSAVPRPFDFNFNWSGWLDCHLDQSCNPACLHAAVDCDYCVCVSFSMFGLPHSMWQELTCLGSRSGAGIRHRFVMGTSACYGSAKSNSKKLVGV